MARPFDFRFLFADRLELIPEPEPIVERNVDRVEIRTTVHSDGVIKGDTQLYANTMKQTFSKLEDTGVLPGPGSNWTGGDSD